MEGWRNGKRGARGKPWYACSEKGKAGGDGAMAGKCGFDGKGGWGGGELGKAGGEKGGDGAEGGGMGRMVIGGGWKRAARGVQEKVIGESVGGATEMDGYV